MSLQSAPYFWVRCDRCQIDADYGDYTAWKEADMAEESLEDSDWWIDGPGHYCDDCWTWDDGDNKCVKPAEPAGVVS
jgi:hypothetical protein